MRASRKLIVIIPFGLVILMNVGYSAAEMVLFKSPSYSTSEDFAPNSLEISYSLSQEPPPPIILIDGNNDFAAQASAKNWDGNGSITNPYVIEGISITLEPDAIGIEIKNTDVYFQVANCLLIGGEEVIGKIGIRLGNVTNGQVSNNTVTNGICGMYLDRSHNITIVNNTLAKLQGYRGYGTGIMAANSDNNVFDNNRIVNNEGGGIIIGNCNNNVIVNNTLTNNNLGGICFWGGCNNNVLANNTVANNNDAGIYLDESSNNVLVNNTVANNNDAGIYLDESSNNIFRTNNLVNNSFSVSGYTVDDWLQAEVVENLVNGKTLVYWQNTVGGTVPADAGQIILINVTDVEVTGQNISNAGIGLLAVFSQQLNIHDNTFTNNSDKGICLYFSCNNILRRNNLVNNGFSVSGETLEDWLQAEVVDNLVNGKPLIFWQNTVGGTVPVDAGQIILVNATGVEATNQNISKAEIGLLAVFSQDLNIHDNSFTNNSEEGIVLWKTNNNTLVNNIVANNLAKGIYLYVSYNNILTTNTVDNNDGEGIFLDYSRYNTLTTNTVDNNDGEGIFLDYSRYNTLTTNIVTNNRQTGIWLRGSHNNTLTNNMGANNQGDGLGIRLFRSSNNILRMNNLNRIELWMSHSNLLVNNTVANNQYRGISIDNSDRNTLTNNTVANNQLEGIVLGGSSNNLLDNNVVVNNQWGGINIHLSDRNTLTNNMVANNQGGGISLGGSPNNLLDNNVVVNNRGSGIRLQTWTWWVEPSASNVIIYNFISNNSEYGIELDQWAHSNTFSWNQFLGNNPGGTSQANDSHISTGFSNTFNNNYWDDWTSPDVNDDGFVDEPYPIDGEAENQDASPLVSSYYAQHQHHLLPPRIIFPNGREILDGSITISWYPAYDYHFDTIKYSVYFSSDAGNTWTLLEGIISNTLTHTNIDISQLTWNAGILPSGSNYMVKVIATCSEGLNSTDISDEPFSIINSSGTSSTTLPTSNPSTGTVLFLVVITLLVITKYRKKNYRKL
ncbi:MAG: right-handed parallel beta-helix repeat-containing protein [Candidatus Hodarchaeales archaeon]